jgi:hypothetical protein
MFRLGLFSIPAIVVHGGRATIFFEELHPLLPEYQLYILGCDVS